MLMKSNYGNEAEIIVEEILKCGRDSTSSILIRSVKRVSSSSINDSNGLKLQR